MVVLELIKGVGLWTGSMVPVHPPFSGANSFRDFFLNVFLIQSLGTTNYLSWNNPSWSISCEAAGYVAFAFVTLLGITKTKVFQIIAVPMAIAGYVFVLHIKGTLMPTTTSEL